MRRFAVVFALAVVVSAGIPSEAQRRKAPREPDILYVPTPQPVVDEMLRVAGVAKDDVVYDLGSGDGRIVISAAKQYGARGVGVEIDPKLVRLARENARREGVSGLVAFRAEDMFRTDLSKATVVTLYLLEDLNIKLRPKLLRELAPGSRIVSHSFRMGDWEPERTVEVAGDKIYLWTVGNAIRADRGSDRVGLVDAPPDRYRDRL
jgi:hypothetical protein